MAGMKKGIEIGKNKTLDVLAEVLIHDLSNEKGIGVKTQEKIADAIGKVARNVSVKEDDFHE